MRAATEMLFVFHIHLVWLTCVIHDSLTVIAASSTHFIGYSGRTLNTRDLRGIVENPALASNMVSNSPELPNDLDQATALLEYIDSINERADDSNCLNANLDGFLYRPSTSAYTGFQSQTQTALTVANILNDLLQNPRSIQAEWEAEKEFYISLVKSVVSGDSSIHACSLWFDTDDQKSILGCKYDAYKNTSTHTRVVTHVRNCTPSYSYPQNTERWFLTQKQDNFSYLFLPHESTTAPVLTTRESGKWSLPYYNCSNSKHGSWLITYSVPFFGLISTRTEKTKFKGVVAIHIDLQRHDINQCTAHGNFFSGTNRCQPETTKCIPIPGRGFSVGAYKCQCKKGYYFPNITANVSYFDGLEMERVYFSDLQKNKNSSFSEEFQCLPCKRGCDQCVDDSPCLVEYDFRLMRGIPLGIQSFCMTIVLIIGIVIIRIRKKKAIKVSMWIMLEIILFGALLMYTSVVVQYFEPTTLTCILVPWFREVGFAIVFGALILKIYRFLAEFQTRRARRVHIRDKDLLKYLLGLVIIVLGYMCAWTAANFQHEHDGSSLTEMGMIAEGTQFVVCKSHWWDYIIEVAEFLFLCCGIYLCYCIRSAPSLFAETRYISWAIYNETVISAILHVARHFLLTILHPDYMFLMYFLRCHLTVSVTLVLVFGPKLWYTHRPPKTDFRGRAFSDVDEITKLRMGLTLNGEVTDMNIAEMDPEEIKGELKRLYTQLQIFKTKSMRKDNPHISKRRGGRKPTHRRFSLQPFAHHHKHSRHRDHEHEYEMSRTPEESTNSAEGITIIVEDTTNGEHDEAQSTSHQAQCLQKESSPGPTVTFKPGTKRC